MNKAILFPFLLAISFLGLAHEPAETTDYLLRENKGQWPNQVIGMRIIDGGLLFFEKNRLHYQFEELPDLHSHDHSIYEKTYKHHNFNVNFLGSNENPRIETHGQSAYYHNYLIGNDPEKWGKKARDIETIVYKDLYDGIDLKYYTKGSNVKFDFIVAAGVNAEQIKLQYEGGVDLSIDNKDLVIRHTLGLVKVVKPYAYQEINGIRQEVKCLINVRKNTARYSFPNGYDDQHELIIDPEVIYFTYTGSRQSNFGMTATDDTLGNGYVGGAVFGTGYDTTTNAYDKSFNGGRIDISISKYSPDGSRLIYGTYIGGSRLETIHSMVVDDSDDSLNLFFIGVTSSSNFPTTVGAHNRTFVGASAGVTTETFYDFAQGTDIVISKLDSSGSNLLGSTFFGGSEMDGLNFPFAAGQYDYIGLLYNYGDSHRGEIIIDSSGNCLIASATRSPNISASINSISGLQDGILAKFDNQLENLIWTRYIGGTNNDMIYSVKIIDSNKIVIGGGTQSHTDFPITSNSYKPNSGGGRSEGFVSILSSDGNTIEYSTFIGTNSYDQVYFVDFDRFQNIYAYGQTSGGAFPLKKVDNIPRFAADTGAGQFFVKLNPTLDSAIFSMTFGDAAPGVPNISPTAFLVDRCQNVFAAGWGGRLGSASDAGPLVLTDSMPITPDAFDKTTDNRDFYFYVLSRDADSVYYATFFGNGNQDHVDGGTSRFDKEGIVYQSLCADCAGIRNNYAPQQSASVHAFQNRVVTGNTCDNALLKFDMSLRPKAGYTVSDREACLTPGDTVQITVTDISVRADQYEWDFFGNNVSGPLPNGDTTLIFTTPGIYDISMDITDTICLRVDSFTNSLVIRPDNITLDPTGDTLVCFGNTLNISAGASEANTFHWSSFSNFSDTLSLNENFTYILSQGIDTLFLKAGNSITNACEKLDTIVVEYVPTFSQPSIQEDTICQNTAVQFDIIGSNIDRFIWDFDNGRRDSSSLDPIVNYPAAGDYNILFMAENFTCNVIDTTILPLNVVNNDISLASLNDTLVCRQDTLLLEQNASGTGIEAYLWSSDSLFSDTLNDYPLGNSFTTMQSGRDTFFVKVSNRYCLRTDDIRIEIVPFELELGSLPDSVCTPYSQQLNTTIIGTDSFRINLGDGRTTNTDPNPFVEFNSQGLFDVELLGYNSKCQIRDTLSESIRVFNGVELNYASDTAICFGDDAVLIIEHNETASSFIWSTNSDLSNPLNNPQDSLIAINPNITTRYYYAAINGICNADSSVLIQVDDIDIFLSSFESICLDDTLAIIPDVQSNFPPFDYSWSPNIGVINTVDSDTLLVSPPSSQRYNLRVVDGLQCFDTASSLVEVTTPRFTTATIISDRDSIFKGEDLAFSTDRNGNNLSYEWSPAAYFNNSTAANPIASLPESTTIQLIIYDAQTGCEVMAQKRIGVSEINCSIPDVFIPSAFTPNGDGNNDILYVRGLVVDEIELSIYNRWGEKVFETNSQDIGWDGTYQGKAADPGVFVYHLNVRCFDGQEFFNKGNVTLIR